MSHVLEAQRAAAHTRLGHLLTLTLCCAVLLQATCIPPQPLGAAPGLPEWQEIAAIPVPGGARVNVLGGNLALARTDLEIDTQLGGFAVGATWNSATRQWRWSFDGVQVVAGTYTDATGYANPFAALANGDALPGTSWVRVNYNACEALQIKTKGGLQHDFRCDGRPLYVHWSSSYEPYLRYTHEYAGDGQLHTTSIDQCLAAGGGCHPVYDFTYDAAGRVTSIVDRAGRTALFGYDANGRLVQARDGLDVANGWPGTRYGYDAVSGHLTSVTNSEGERVEYEYANNRATVVRQIGLGNPTQTFVYEGKNAAGLHVTRHIDALGNETRFRYDDLRNLREVQSMATGELVVRAWAAKRMTSLVRADGATTTWSYANDDVASRVDASGNVTTYTYAPNGVDRDRVLSRPVLAITDSLGPIESRSYDAAGRLLAVTNGAGETQSLAYGSDQMIATRTHPSGLVWSYAGYGEHGHATSVTPPGVPAVTRSFDSVGNQVGGALLGEEVRPGGEIARHYDADRNLSAVDYAGWSISGPMTVAIENRSDGRRRAIRRPTGGDHELVYDALGRMIALRERVDGTWRVTTHTYDAAGRLTATELANGMRRELLRDAVGRPTSITARQDGAIESSAQFVYTNGRLRSIFDSVDGAAETYTYDAAGRLVLEVFPQGESTVHAYDLRSRRVRTDYQLDGLLRTTRTEYDAAGRTARLLDGSQPIAERSWDDGRIATTSYGNGLASEFSYESGTGEVAGSVVRNAAAQLVASTTVSRSPASTIFGGATQVSDGANTLIGVTAGSGGQSYLGPYPGNSLTDGNEGKRVLFGHADYFLYYDALSNMNDGGMGWEYNAESNRLLAGVLHYDYDEAGFQIEREGVPLTWTATGKLASYGDDISLQWDTLGRLRSLTENGVTTKWRFGGRVEATAAGVPTAIDLGEVRIGLNGAGPLYRHADFRGNVRFTTNAAGQVAAHYDYSTYGVTTTIGASNDKIRFVGRRQIGDLYLLGSRVYDPAVGRFLSPDPVLQIASQYAYAQGNPIQFWDPDGENPALIAGLVAMGFTFEAVAMAASAQGFTQLAFAFGIFGALMGLGGALFSIEGGGNGGRTGDGDSSSGVMSNEAVAAVQGVSSSGTAGISCAPTALGRSPRLGWSLTLLLALELILGAMVLRRRRSAERAPA